MTETARPAGRRWTKADCEKHHGPQHFKVGAHEWKCSNCGLVSIWRDSWSYFGMLSCVKCGCEPAIEFVACSDNCARALAKKYHRQEAS